MKYALRSNNMIPTETTPFYREGSGGGEHVYVSKASRRHMHLHFLVSALVDISL